MSEYKLPDNQDCFQQNYDMRQEEIAAEIAAMNRNYHGHDTDDDGSPKVHLEQEKRVRREIANSNERRRMQSINAGFASLRNLIPHHKGEKLSKAAILQQASDFLHNLVQEKACLLSQNAQLKRMIDDISNGRVSDTNAQESPPPKRKKRDTESSDEGISMSQEISDDPITTPTTTPPSAATIESSVQVVQREICELRGELEAERQIRKRLEDQTQVLEEKIYPEGIRHIGQRMEFKVKDDDHIILGSTRSEITSCTDDDEEDASEKSKSSQQCPYSYSMSRRNLNTIVAAIRHLEGDRIALTDKEELKLEENERNRIPVHSGGNEREHHRIPLHSEDSERETSSTSDQEDIKSDSSGRDSPVNLHVTRPISQNLSSAILSSPHSLSRSHHTNSVSPGIAALPISANTGIIPRLLEAPPITLVAATPQTFYSHVNVAGPEHHPGSRSPPYHSPSHPQGPVIEFRTLAEKFPMSIPYHLHHTVPTVYHHRPGVIVHNASS